MIHVRLDRNHDMNALTASQFRPTLEIGLFDHRPQHQRRIGYASPFDSVARIEIEHEHVGMFEIVDRGVPRMNFDDIHVDEAQEAIDIIDLKPETFAAFAFFDAQLMYGIRNGRQLSLMIEDDVADPAHEL
jgi:hypothetical protein